jgi:hypothetical protein
MATNKTTSKAPAKTKKVAGTVVEPTSEKAAEMPKRSVKKSKNETKVKAVRVSFAMPKTELLKIAEIKEACLRVGLHVKKGGVLRAGLKVLGAMNDAQLKRAMSWVAKDHNQPPKRVARKA